MTKEIKLDKKLIQCWVKVSFQHWVTLKNIKIRTKLFHLRYEIFCKLYIYTFSKLVIYTFTFWYSLSSRAFPKAKYSVVCTEFPVGSKFYFHNGKFIFPNSFSLINTSNSRKLIVSSIKFKMWPALFYVNSLNF